jgi:hypothetical protein
LSGTWGDTVNNYITTYLDSSIAGSVTITADTTLTKTTNASLGATSSQYAVIIASPASANITITAPAASKIYTIINTSATYTVKIVGAGPTTGVTLGVSEKAQVAWNGSDFIKVASSSISNLTGTLPVANGGTGLTSGTSGGVLYYSAAGTIASSAALAANALVVGGGAGVTPATVTTGTGVLTFLGTPSSANLASAVTDETGSGALVFATSPTLVTPVLGTPSSGNLANCTFPTLNQNTTGTAAGLSATLAVGSGGTGVTTSTGSGSVVLSTSPTLVTPVLGTPASGNLANCTFPTLNQNTTGTAAGLSSTLAVASGGTGVTSSTGTGSVVLSSSPSLTNPTFTNYTETRYAATVTSNAITLDLANGTFQTITTMVGANAITLPAVGSGKSLTVQILYASTPTTLTFASPSGSLKYPNGTTPTPTLTNTKYDFYSFVSDGTNWYGVQTGANF